MIEYLPYYTEEERHRHDVRPGLTGWAQVNGRNNSTWNQRFEKDIEYINAISFLFDTKILLLTVKKIISHSDIVVAGENSIKDLDEERNSQNGTYNI